MGNKIILLRMVIRNLVVVGLTVAVVLVLAMLIREMPADPSGALVSLLSVGLAGLVAALGAMVKALSSNMESQSKNGDDDEA